MNKNIFFASFLVLGLAACGDNVDNMRPDSRPTTDAPPVVDGSDIDASDIDASGIDAAASTVTVTPGACAAGPNVHVITNVGLAFRVDAVAVDNPPMIFNVGDQVSVTTNAQHNFVSVAGTPAQFVFRSGNLGVDACLTFTAEIPALAGVNYRCEAHATMTNTLVVLP